MTVNSDVVEIPFADPGRTETAGIQLATGVRDLACSAVVCWDSSEDVVLAHVVARETGAVIRPAIEVEGIVSLLQPLPDGATVVLVAESFHATSALASIAGVVAHEGGRVVAVAVASGSVDPSGTTAAGARLVRYAPGAGS